MNTQPVLLTRHVQNVAIRVGAIHRLTDRYRYFGRYFELVAGILLLIAASMLPTQAAFAATAPPLGTTTSFAVLGATPNVNNIGPTVITGDLGVSPAAAIVGFPPGNVIGTMHAANATAATAQVDNTTAYGALAAQACNVTFAGPTDLAGMTLVPGVYCFGTSAANSGLLKLDAGGNNAAVWIFRTASTLITGSASTVQMINAGQDCNVFWQVGSSATLGTATTFVGNILALTSITLQTGATLSGRALAQTGTVTLANNTISVCSLLPPPPPVSIPPTVSTTFVPSTINVGALSTLSISLLNSNATDATMSVARDVTLPAGLMIASAPSASTTCGGTGAITAVPGAATLGVGAGRIIAAKGSCTVAVNVAAASPGSFAVAIPAGWLQTNHGTNANPATATLTVNAVILPTVLPVLGKAFNPTNVNVGAVTTLTITLSNANATVATLSAALVDTLPSGMVVASTPNASATCGGSVIAVAGASTVSLSAGSTIPSNGSCVINVSLLAQSAGSLVNTLPVGALQTNNGNNGAAAIATLTVSAIAPPVIIAPSVGIPTLSDALMAMLVVMLMLIGASSVRRPPSR